MRNIPVFTGEFGAATLILQEIPGRGEAYCVVQWVQPGKTWEFLAECARFLPDGGSPEGSGLPSAGAPRRLLLKSGCSVWPACGPACRRRTQRCGPLLPENGEEFLRIYNEGMSGVPAAMSLHQGICPGFWTRGRIFCPQGRSASGNWPGEWGYAPVPGLPAAGGRARCGGGSHFGDAGETVELQVAESNLRARALYEKLGFLTVGAGECWWEI